MKETVKKISAFFVIAAIAFCMGAVALAENESESASSAAASSHAASSEAASSHSTSSAASSSHSSSSATSSGSSSSHSSSSGGTSSKTGSTASGSASSKSSGTSSKSGSTGTSSKLAGYTEGDDVGSDLQAASDTADNNQSVEDSSLVSEKNITDYSKTLSRWIFIPIILIGACVFVLIYVNYTAYIRNKNKPVEEDVDLSSYNRKRYNRSSAARRSTGTRPSSPRSSQGRSGTRRPGDRNDRRF